MPYIEGFVAAVPTKNKDAYRKHVQDSAPLFKELGATRMVETWANDVPDGRSPTSSAPCRPSRMRRSCSAGSNIRPRHARRGQKKMMNERAHEGMGAAMPFDGHRMIYGGFAPS